MNKPAIHTRISRLPPLYRIQDEPAWSVGFPAKTVFTAVVFIPSKDGSSTLRIHRYRQQIHQFHDHISCLSVADYRHTYPFLHRILCIIQSHGRSDVFTARILSVHLLRIVTYGGFYLRIIEINQIRIPLGMSLLSQ